MNKKILIILLAIMALAFVFVFSKPAKSQDPAPITECPADTAEGVYFERGVGKDGNVICGFQFYNECPYASGYSATDDMCKKFEEQHQKQFTPSGQIKSEVINQDAAEIVGK